MYDFLAMALGSAIGVGIFYVYRGGDLETYVGLWIFYMMGWLGHAITNYIKGFFDDT